MFGEDSKHMTNHTEQRTRPITSLVLGGILILIGFLLFVMQILNIHIAIGSAFWPFFVIVPGVLLFSTSLTNSGKEGERLAILGSIVTMVGLLLLYQNSTDHWENWAYTWALIMPTAVGVGQLLYGSLKHQQELVKGGARLMIIGSVIFLVGFFFFEVVIGIGGFGFYRFGLARFSWPILLIGVGGLVILYNLLVKRDSQPPHQGPVQ
jgi:hypothetical protein